jgi:hypothetical protein
MLENRCKCPMEIRRYHRGEESAVWSVFFAATHESNARDYHADLIERWAPRDKDMGQWTERLAQTNPFVAVVDEGMLAWRRSSQMDSSTIFMCVQGGKAEELERPCWPR